MNPSRWRMVAVLAKVALAVLLMFALLFPEWDQFSDKAMGARAIAYPLLVFVVPLLWVLRGRRGSFPWDIDALVTLPFLVDVAGNATDLYDRVGWFDDLCHFGNWALMGFAIAVAVRRWGSVPSWAVGVISAGTGAVIAILWEFAEYQLFILDTPEVATIYRDTVGDLMLGLSGATVAGIIIALRTSTDAVARVEPSAELVGESTGA